MKIKSIAQAQQHLRELTAGLNDVREFMDQLPNYIAQSIMGTVSGTTPTPSDSSHVVVAGEMPETWSDRVFQIFETANSPLTPKQTVELYVQRRWVRPDDDENGRKLYTKVVGSIDYLHKRKEILEKVGDGLYQIKR